jgi:hypothetical protein
MVGVINYLLEKPAVKLSLAMLESSGRGGSSPVFVLAN